MAHWRRKVLNEMTERIVQLGLQTCPICGSGEIVVGRHPVIQSIGAVYQESERRRDLDSNILFMVQVTCRLCGYTPNF